MRKLLARVPVTEILLVVTEFGPTFVMVMVWGGLIVFTVCVPKLRLVGEKLRTVPIPVSVTVCGLLAALSLTVRVPVCEPALRGLKTTLIVQLAPAARLVPQLLVWANGPVVAMLVMLIATVPVLVSVAVCAGLVVLMT